MTEYDEQDPFIAVVGMAGRFPGAADLAGFWDRLAAGDDCVTRFGVRAATGRTPAYAVVADSDRFDADFFGFSGWEALMLDPQHRVFMECAWEALENAGVDPAEFPGAVGVYGGSGDTGHFGTLCAHRAQLPAVSDWQLRLASGADFLTSRVSYKLGLTGPAVTVQTACSTSLVAVHVASQALIAGECDLALAGGVTVRVPCPVDDNGEEGVLSPDGTCRAFDADANGTVAGDGAGVVALKRLEDAMADGDHIHAVVRGSAVNNDGSGKIGFTAPSIDGQAAAVRAAHVVAGVDAADISYVEAHGTGTPVGDPIEVRALTKAFEASGSGDMGECALGSVKANIGHTDAAAGVIGLIKVVLSLTHERIPATPHFRTPNPQLELESSPFTVSASARPWPRTSTPRRAGVNSLGLGGTNAHVVVEEPPCPTVHQPGRPYQVLAWSARTESALAESTRRLADHIGGTDAPLEDIAWTLQTGRRDFTHRRFAVCRDRDDAVRAVRATDVSQNSSRGSSRECGVAFLFPGQGGQHIQMARGLYLDGSRS
ncbi:polyketide synthase [Rhodococcus sp. WS4]|nr:polyketide synthase [Rhodococcus sp. WS4]